MAQVVFLGNTNMFTVMPVASTQRHVFYHQHSAGMYSSGPYVLAQVWHQLRAHSCVHCPSPQMVMELPYLALQTVLFTNIVFWMIGYNITAGV